MIGYRPASQSAGRDESVRPVSFAAEKTAIGGNRRRRLPGLRGREPKVIESDLRKSVRNLAALR